MNNRERANARREGIMGTYEGVRLTAADTRVNFWDLLERQNNTVTTAYPTAELTDDAIILGDNRIPKEIFVEAYNKWIGGA